MKKTLIFLVSIIISFNFVGSAYATNINLLPMYGKVQKTEEQIKCDNDFLESITSKGLDRKKASQQVAKKGWYYFGKGDWETAMKRFNQTWLLDPENSESYHGFAIISADRKERLFLKSAVTLEHVAHSKI